MSRAYYRIKLTARQLAGLFDVAEHYAAKNAVWRDGRTLNALLRRGLCEVRVAPATGRYRELSLRKRLVLPKTTNIGRVYLRLAVEEYERGTFALPRQEK